MSFRTKLAEIIGGKKNLSQLPASRQVDGKTYYALTDVDFEKLFKVLNCEYTDYNLVQLFYSIAEVFAPLHMIASFTASAQWQLKRVADDEVVYDNKFVNDLLQKPNPLQNWSQFIYESVIWQYINGDNYIYANAPDTLALNYKNISTLTNLWSYMVQVLHDPSIKLLSATKINDIVKGYRLNGMPDIATEKVLHSQFISLDYNDKKLKGKSPLLSNQKALANLIAVYEARGSIYVNRGALGMLTSKVSDAGGSVALTPDEKKEVRDDYNAEYGLVNGKSPVAITGIPMEWLRMGMSIAELLPFEETYADAAVIYGVLQVPQDLMPTPKGATFENQKQSKKALYQDVAIPLAKSRAAALTSFLKLDVAGFYLDANHDHIEVLQDNRKEKAETDKIENERLLIQYRSGVITMNDWIRATGGEVVKLPLYDKRTLEMQPDERELVLSLLNTKGGVSAPAANNNSNG